MMRLSFGVTILISLLLRVDGYSGPSLSLLAMPKLKSANQVFIECDSVTECGKLVFRWLYVLTTSVLLVGFGDTEISVNVNTQPLRKSDIFDNVRTWRGVKEKEGTINDGSSRDNNRVNDVNVNVTSSTDVDLVMAGHDNLHDENAGQTPNNSTTNPNKGTSFALFSGESSRKSVNFSTLIIQAGNRIDVVILLESIFLLTLFGFPIVVNYVRNTWGKYGVVKSMLNSSTRLFFFQFSSMDGLDSMLENGPWFILNNSLILKKWNLNVNLMKEDVGNILVWVKLHGVPATTFSEDGLSVIATKLALIEIRADEELKYTIVVAMPQLVREGFYTCTNRVEYEWKPPRCACCKIFGHVQDECPKKIDSGMAKNLKKPSQSPRGVLVGLKVGFKPAKQVYRTVFKKTNANTSENKKKDVEPTKEKVTLVDDEDKPLEKVDSSDDHDSEDEVESVDNEMASFFASKKVDCGTNSLLEQ
ncbi:putative RNA-directed DNA polymerase [Tanacetum coccineum]